MTQDRSRVSCFRVRTIYFNIQSEEASVKCTLVLESQGSNAKSRELTHHDVGLFSLRAAMSSSLTLAHRETFPLFLYVLLIRVLVDDTSHQM